MAIQCIPNGKFFLSDRCDGCCVTDVCEEKVFFTEKDKVSRHVKDSLLLCLAACHQAELDIDQIFDSITDADVSEAARRITMAEVK